MSRAHDKPLRMPVVDRYKDMGTILIGKIESGVATKNQTVYLMPNKVSNKYLALCPVQAAQWCACKIHNLVVASLIPSLGELFPGVFLPLTSLETCGKSSQWLWKEKLS